MFRSILLMGFTLLFAFARTCDFKDDKQDECEIDIKNPPLMEHKFIKDDGSAFSEYHSCINGGDIEIDDVRYEVLDCSMVENKNGALTEGVTISNGKNLIKNRIVTIKQDNVLLRVAGDFVVDSGIRFNTKNAKKFIVEMIEGTNAKSNVILQRGAALNANMLIMPEGGNSNVVLNTFYGGIYEKEFIDLINQKSPASRGEMETILSVDDVIALSPDGSELSDFNGGVFCGPEVNPLDLKNKNYILKRLYRVKNASIDAPSDKNAICSVKEGECFENLLAFNNRKFDGKSFKIASANAKIIPTYDIFIESGKIISSDNRAIKDIFPSAKIKGQNGGACDKPAKLAFDKKVVEKYLADLEVENAKKIALDSAKNAESAEKSTLDSAKDSATQNAESEMKIAQNALDSAKSETLAKNAESTQDSATDSADKIAESTQDSQIAQTDEQQSPIAAELNAELDENLQDLLSTFNSEKLAESKKSEQNAESTADSAELDIVKPAKKELLDINDEFLLVEKNAYEQFKKSCYGDLQCIYNELLPYDKVVWSKKSSKNAVNEVFALNVSDEDLTLVCEVKNHYGKNIKKSFTLSATNTIGIIDLKFPTSSDTTQITCKGAKQEKTTNKIIATPAKFDMDYSFANDDLVVKAGNVKINFKSGVALTAEGEIDSGFNQNLTLDNVSFTQKEYCASDAIEGISAPNDLRLRFKGGYLQNASMDIVAKIVAFGNLKLNFAIANNDKNCATSADTLKPTCTSAEITKEISIIPANFRVKTDILSTSNKVAYYGQLEDKLNFKHNPLLKVDIEALDSDGGVIDINKNCNYGSIELGLQTDKLIEFKRTSSDRLNSKIIVYLRDFTSDKGTSIKAYFGINKIIDSYQNARKITQGDLLEPTEITLFDFIFNLRLKSGKTQFVYDNLEVYDKLDEKSNPESVLLVRGKLQTDDINGEDSAFLIAKYALYCKTCDKNILAKYLQRTPEAESQFWYINTQHPNNFYIRDRFISHKVEGKNRAEAQKEGGKLTIKNSNTAFEGRQKITFLSDKSENYEITLAQGNGDFAPYLNYNRAYKNKYIANEFKAMIKVSEKVPEPIIEPEATIKPEPKVEPKPVVKPTVKPAPKPAVKPAVKPAPKPAVKPAAKPAPKKSDKNIKLDIED
ncbi:hypothetical protein ACWIUD_05765 [Helicobacter sp. 23-1044]